MAFGFAALNGNEWQAHSCRVLQWQRITIAPSDLTRPYLTLLDLIKKEKRSCDKFAPHSEKARRMRRKRKIYIFVV